MRKAHFLLYFKILLFWWIPANAQLPDGIDIYRFIEENKIDSIAYFLEQGHDINGIYPKNTLLEMAIAHNNLQVVEYLISRSANVNLQNNRSSPLYIGVHYGKIFQSNEIVETLVSNNADVNFKAYSGYTPFTLACRIGNAQAARYLYENGADPSINDRSGRDFMYHVLRGNESRLISYFISKGFEIPRMSSVTDGPYVRLTDDGATESYLMKYDSITDKAEWTQRELNDEAGWMPGKEQIDWFLNQNIQENKTEFNKVEKVFVVSDIHGIFNELTGLLIANRIIDKNLAWIFGDGHLVIAGDVFDRGDLVTECLWLIFNLEYQAQLSGGMVHVLLGNHELMIIKDLDKRYLHDKYVLPYAKAGLDLLELFGDDYILGKWLRSKNIVIKINKTLIVHAGIPPQFVALGRTIDQMNKSFRQYIADPSEITESDRELIIDPVWYRGYFEKTDMSADISAICKYYKSKKIVVGHTTVDKVQLLQRNLVVGVGVHFTGPERPAEGLLILKNKYYRCNAKGKTYPL